MINRSKGVSRKLVVAVSAGVAVLICAAVAFAGQSFKNGGFETGTFSDWTTAQHGAGNWFVSRQRFTPINRFEWKGPVEKTWAAVTDQTGPSSNILYRTIDVEKSSSRLSMIIYYKNHGTDGAFCTPASLDETVLPCNQQFRVDIMVNGADPFSMNPADILLPVYSTPVGASANLKPKKISVSLNGLSGPVMLRIAEVDNQGYFNASVDSVTLNNG